MGAYRVSLEPRITVKDRSKDVKPPLVRRQTVLAGVVAILLLGIAAGLWQRYLRPPSMTPVSVDKMAFPLPDKPSIAVLPFVNLSADANQEYFSDGLTEAIITALSNVPKLFVIARNSVFTYKGKPVKVQQVSEELGVRYVLEGSVKKAAQKIRVTAQLIDAVSGHHLWAEQYDRNLDDIFAVQDKITKSIITAMQVKLTEGEQARAASKGTDNLEAYIKYLQAVGSYHLGNMESSALAKQFAKEAIALDPDYAVAYCVLARAHLFDFWLDTGKSQKHHLAEATRYLQKALAIDDTYAEAHGQLGWVMMIQRQLDQALVQAQKSVALNPNSAESHYIMGKVLTFSDRHAESILEYKTALRLNPIPPNSYFWSLGLSYGVIEQYDEAIAWCEKAIQQEPNALFARIMATVVYSWAGQDEKARTQAAEVLRINPNFSLERFSKRAGGALTEALRKAGLK